MLDGSENLRTFVPPVSPGGGKEPYEFYDSAMQGHVYFESPSQNDSTLESDNAAADENYYYMWSENRGLFKGEMFGDDWNWNNSNGSAEVKDVYK